MIAAVALSLALAAPGAMKPAANPFRFIPIRTIEHCIAIADAANLSNSLALSTRRNAPAYSCKG